MTTEQFNLFIFIALCFCIFGTAFVILAYVSARAAAIGYFRTKLEHFKHILQLTEGGHDNGNEE